MKVGDLIHVPPVRTVIRLADLGEHKLRRQIIESFVLTNEVSFAISTLLGKVASSQGEGFFVIGNYGSGKSHLLNILSLTISDTEARQSFILSCQDSHAAESNLPESLEKAAATKPLVVEISLVEHSNREYLEQIVLKEIAAKLKTTHFNEKTDNLPENLAELTRQEAFEILRDNFKEGGYGGLLLLIDELSEFLRSKENPRAYNEDVRFLQYLGEFAETIPAWIVATMQENIENTGSLTGELLHKIKDRYPVRFQLSGEHVKEIVSGRLVQKRDDAEKKLPQIMEELENAFGLLPFSREDFFELYPVHPVTVELLDELRPLFSQHRGVIDFIHYRLAGDSGRGIEPFLEQPASELLTPDYIFDHFRDRIRETVETNPYSEQVYHHYEREINRIFSEPADARVALRLVKLLILGALARAPRSFSSEELTRLLLHSYSSLESRINYDYINEIMIQLQTHGAYIAAVEQKDGIICYTIDLKADVGLLMEKKINKIMGNLTPGDQRIVNNLIPWIDESYLPLKQLQKEPLRKEEITWQNTLRTGKTFFNTPAELSPEMLADLEEELKSKETDFIFFLSPPFFGINDRDTSPWAVFNKELSDELRRSIILWVPREINTAEENMLQRAYAHHLLQDEYSNDNSPVGRQISKQLTVILQEEKFKVKELFRNLYFQGRLRTGEHMPSPSSFGYVPFTDLIARIAAEVLKNKYPRHAEIRPLSEQVSGSLIQRTLDLLFSPQLDAEGLERGTKMVIESHLAPLGLVKKKGQGYHLEINPKSSPLTAEFLSRIPDTGLIPLERLYNHLRKGPFGLSSTGFQILGTAAILSGAISSYQGGKRLAPSQVNYYRFWNIEEIGPGTLIRQELQKVLTEIPFLPSKLRNSPLTFATQQQTWEAVIAFKVEWTGKAADIKRRIEQLKEHPFFSSVNWDNQEKTINRFITFLEEIKTSYASREGLERFLAACQSSPLIAADWNRLSALEKFFSEDLSDILRISQYLNDIKIKIPSSEKYKTLQKHYTLLTDLLEEEALLWEEKYRERLKREFKQFRDNYITLYLAEHDQAVGPERIKPYRAIMETDAYQLLEQLGKINAVMIKNDLVEINRVLAEPLDNECSAANEMRLIEQPHCTCNFALGNTIELPARTALEIQIRRGLKAYLETLQAPEQKQKIKAHAEHLELVGRRREAAPLQELIKIDIAADEKVLIKKLGAIINQTTIDQINRALTGDAMIVERSVEELQDLMAGRVFNTSQLNELFQSWLSGSESSPPDYIRVTQKEKPSIVTSKSNAIEAADQGLQARPFLAEKAPRLIPLAGQVREEKLFALALLWGWLHNFFPPGEKGDPAANTADFFKNLVSEHLKVESNDENDYYTALKDLGEFLLTEKEILQPSFLESAAAAATSLVTVEELIEYFYRFTSAAPQRFEALLELLTDEPFFPALSHETAKKLAVQISAEESVPQLNIITGMLSEAGKNLSREKIGLNDKHRLEKQSFLQTLHTLAKCSLILNDTEKIVQSTPESDKNWERLYHMLAPFELALASLEEPSVRRLVPEATIKHRRRRYASLLEPLNEAFAIHYEQETSSRRQTLYNLFRQLPGWTSKEKGLQGVFLAIIDGARLDVWKALLDKALADYNLQILREGLLWAMQPTVTENQLAPLKEEGLLGHVLNMDEQLVAELISDPNVFLQAADNLKALSAGKTPLKALKFNFIDDKIHSSRDKLPVLLEELQLQTRKKLHPLLEYLPPGAIMLIAADHGFRTNLYHNKDSKEEPLYLHGSNTFFEALAPWTLVKKR